MLTLHVESKSMTDLVEQVRAFLGGSGTAVLEMPAEAEKAPVEIKGKPGRPSKPKMEEAIAANRPQSGIEIISQTLGAPTVSNLVAADPFAAETQAPAVTFDQVKSALQKLAVLREGEKDPQVGYNRVGAIISKFGVDKVKNLKPEQYAAVLEACGQA